MPYAFRFLCDLIDAAVSLAFLEIFCVFRAAGYLPRGFSFQDMLTCCLGTAILNLGLLVAWLEHSR